MSKTLKQQEIANRLAEQFDIDGERILFLNEEKPDEPWLNAEALITIARRSGNFQEIDEGFNQFVTALNQVIHTATVVDKEGRRYTRTGVATIGESKDINEHDLAVGRAMGAALTAAGFNPLRPGAAVTLDLNLQKDNNNLSAQIDEARSRTTDLKRIHALAIEKRLITFPGGVKDMAEYRKTLKENYGVTTAGGFNALQRASLINFLERLPEVEVDEFAEVA
jgi:hypothetical protein